MKKIDVLLKKAALFEKFSLYSDRDKFLKSLGAVTAPTKETSSKLLALYDALLKVIREYSPQEHPELNNLIMSLNEKNTVLMGLIKVEELSKEQSVAKVAKTGRILLEILKILNGLSPKLDQDLSDALKKTNTAKSFIQNEYLAHTRAVKSKPQLDPKLAKYYMIIRKGKELLNRISLLHPEIDKKIIYLLKPQFDKLVVDLNTFKHYFPIEEQTGVALNLHKHVDTLLEQATLYDDKMNKGYFLKSEEPGEDDFWKKQHEDLL